MIIKKKRYNKYTCISRKDYGTKRREPMTSRYNEVISRAFSKSERLMFQKRLEGGMGTEGSGVGAGD